MGGQAYEAPRAQMFYLDPDKVFIIGLDTKDGKEHPLYDPRVHLPVTEEQIQNVLAHKIIKPGLIWKEKLGNGETRDVVFDGRQRTRWAREANARLREHFSGAEYEKRMVRVPFLPKTNGDKTLLKRMGTAANMHAQSDMMTKALDAQAQIDSGISKKDVALDFGVTVQALDQWLQVLTLGKKMQEMVRTGAWSPSTAIQYSDMSEGEQDKVIAECERLGVKIGATEAKAQRAARKRTNGANGHDVRRPVGAGVLRKLTEHEDFFGSLEPETQALLKFLIGEQNQDRRVKGLRAALKDIGFLGKDEE